MDQGRSPNKRKNVSSSGNFLTVPVMKPPTFVSPVLQQVGKLAATVVNVGSGSATGSLRSKCALQPGHSLMDWIRLGASAKDLTGLGPRAGHLSVTKQELEKHNKIDDIWLAVRGLVYNVTAYIPFHPGGPEELMRGAGKDATSLFDEEHPWVNFEQILQKCLVGKLVAGDPVVNTEKSAFGSPTKNKVSPAESLNASENSTGDTKKEGNDISGQEKEDPTINLPRYDWIQKLEYITAIFYTGPFSNPLVEIYPPNDQKEITVCISSGGRIYTNELVFHDEVQWPCSIKVFWETGKIELCFKKTRSQVWENYGKLTQSSMNVLRKNMKFDFVLKNKKQVNHNIYLLGFERCDGSRMVVPIGKHFRLFVKVEGNELSRSYTAVPACLFNTIILNDSTPDEVCLMIKRYESGPVSTSITKKEVDEVVLMTKPLGDFDLKRIEKKEAFLMIAAGTGITPMMSLLIFLLERRIKKCQFVRLLFFNKKQEDIAFKNHFDALEKGDSRLKIDYILSEPGPEWKGQKGRINREIIENAILEHIKDTGYTINDLFVFLCGPDPFLNLSLDELQSLEIPNDQIHVFSG